MRGAARKEGSVGVEAWGASVDLPGDLSFAPSGCLVVGASFKKMEGLKEAFFVPRYKPEWERLSTRSSEAASPPARGATCLAGISMCLRSRSTSGRDFLFLRD